MLEVPQFGLGAAQRTCTSGVIYATQGGGHALEQSKVNCKLQYSQNDPSGRSQTITPKRIQWLSGCAVRDARLHPGDRKSELKSRQRSRVWKLWKVRFEKVMLGK